MSFIIFIQNSRLINNQTQFKFWYQCEFLHTLKQITIFFLLERIIHNDSKISSGFCVLSFDVLINLTFLHQGCLNCEWGLWGSKPSRVARVVPSLLNSAWDKHWPTSTISNSWIQWEATQILLIEGIFCSIRNISYSDSFVDIQTTCFSCINCEKPWWLGCFFFPNIMRTRSLFPYGWGSLKAKEVDFFVWSSSQVILFHCKRYMQQTYIVYVYIKVVI